MERKSNPNAILVPYALGTFGLQAIFGFISSFQVEFCNKMYASIDANILFGCALILFVSKLVSSFIDPLIGVYIDRAGRKGVSLFRFIRRGILPLACLTVVMFLYIPFDRIGGKWAMYTYITLVSVLWNIAMSFSEIPMQSLISFMAQNDAGGRKLAAVTNFAKSAGQAAPPILVTVIMLVVDMLRGAGNTQDASYYFINVLCVTFMGALFMVLLAFVKTAGSERASVDKREFAPMSQMLNGLRENKNVRIVFLINLLGFARNMSNAILLQANGALIGKIELFGNTLDTTTNATWIPFLFGNVSAAAALILVPMINNRLKEKKTYVVFAAADFIFSMAAYTFYILQRANSPLRYGNGALYMIMVFSFIGSFLMGVNQFIPLAMTAKIAQDEKRRNGSDYESAPYAVLTMSVKLGTALCAVVGLMIVGAGGYNQLVYQAGQITPQMQNTVMLAFMAIPGVSTLISAIPALFFRPEAEEI